MFFDRYLKDLYYILLMNYVNYNKTYAEIRIDFKLKYRGFLFEWCRQRHGYQGTATDGRCN